MKFFNFLKKSHSPATKISNSDYIRWMNTGCTNIVSPSVAYHHYDQVSALSDAVDMIAERFSSIQPTIIDSEGKPVENNEIANLLENPNTTQGYIQFANQMAVNYLLNNNVFIEVIGNVKFRPNSLYNVSNAQVSITEQANMATYQVNATGFYEFLTGSFILDHELGRVIDRTDLKEIYHIKGFVNQSNGLLSRSKINSISNDLSVVDESLLHVKTLLNKGFSALGILGVDTENMEAISQIKKDLIKNMSGARSAGQLMVAPSKQVNFTKIEQSNRDMQTLENKKDSRETIYQRFDIPKPLIDSSAQTYNNYQTALFSLYDNAVLPMADKLFEGLTKVFADRKMLKEGQRITYDPSSIPALQLRISEELRVLKDANILSDNELRSIIGYEEYEGGDTHYVEASKIPVGEDAFTDDNLEEPRRKFYQEMIKAHIPEDEIEEYWDTYARIITQK